MIFSMRINKIHNQFALLRYCISNVTNRRYSININDNLNTLKGCQKLSLTHGLTPIEYRSFRFVTTSSSRSSQTEVMKGEGDHGLNLDYEDILKAQKDDSVLIVDVREDEEIKETGKLPGSIHVPMGQVADVFSNYSEKAFLDKYQKPKPTKDTKIIFSCRSGKRSATVQEAMIKLGYGNVLIGPVSHPQARLTLNVTRAVVLAAFCRNGSEKFLLRSFNYTGGWLDWESKQSPTA